MVVLGQHTQAVHDIFLGRCPSYARGCGEGEEGILETTKVLRPRVIGMQRDAASKRREIGGRARGRTTEIYRSGHSCEYLSHSGEISMLTIRSLAAHAEKELGLITITVPVERFKPRCGRASNHSSAPLWKQQSCSRTSITLTCMSALRHACSATRVVRRLWWPMEDST